MDFLKEIFKFVMIRKKFWLIPLLIVFLIFGSLLVLTQGTVFAPFIYTVF